MRAPEESKELLDDLEEPAPEIAQPSEAQGGEIDKENILNQLDIYLHRIFQIGEIFPWKGVVFQVIGIRGGVIGLSVKTIRTPPKARANHGVRPSRSKKGKNARRKEQRGKIIKIIEAAKFYKQKADEESE